MTIEEREGLPEGWIETSLEEACNLVTDGTHFSPPNKESGEFMYVTAKNIKKWGLDLKNITYVDSMVHKEIYSRCPVEQGDVLYIKDGATTGIAAINHIKEPFSLLSSVALLKPKNQVLEARFLKQWLNSPETLKKMLADMTGTAIKRLVLKQIRAAEIPLPPLAEQIRIADKLDALLSRVDAGRERLERVPKLVKRFRQSVLSAAVSGELTREWRGGGDAEWEEVSVGDCALTIFDGPFGSNLKSDDYTTEGIRVVRLENLGHLVFRDAKSTYVSEEKFNSLSRHELRDGDLLFSSFIDEEIRACLYNLKYGKAINKADCFVIRIELKKCLPKLLLYFLSNIETYHAFADDIHGATRPRINLKQLRQYLIPLPPLPEQAEIVRRVEALFALADRLEARAQAALARYSRLTPALLAKAFRGELVPQDPADEPASVLLSRIRAQREAAGPAKKAPGRGRKPDANAFEAEAEAGTGEPQPAPKRGRGRPRKVAAEGTQEGARRIPLASNQEDAMRLLQERARAEREGRETVQAGLFGE